MEPFMRKRPPAAQSGLSTELHGYVGPIDRRSPEISRPFLAENSATGILFVSTGSAGRRLSLIHAGPIHTLTCLRRESIPRLRSTQAEATTPR